MGERTEETEVSDADVEDLLEDGATGSSGGGDVDLSDLESDVSADGEVDVGLDDDELGVDVDSLTADPGAASGGSEAATHSDTDAGSGSKSGGGIGFDLGSRLRGIVRNPLPSPSVPSARSFGLSLAVTVVAMLGVGSVVPLPGAALLGVFAGAFLLGAVSDTRRYLELTVSGALAAGVNVLLGSLTLAFLAGLAAPLAVFGAGSGALVAVLGHYFGRDFRDGLTRDV